MISFSEFSVIDVPNVGFLAELQKNEKLKNPLDENKSTGIEMMIHFTPANVFRIKDYQNFVDSVGAKRQLILNDSNK